MRRPEKAVTVVLAAGRSTRMGPDNKLLMEIEPGVPVIRRTVEHAVDLELEPIFVVTGHEAERVCDALEGLPCLFLHNPDYAQGLSGSIRTGFRQAVRDRASGILVLLGDMPFLPAEAIAAVLEAAADAPDRVVQAVHGAKPAHPVWLPARLVDMADRLDGDRGLRSLISSEGEAMISVEVGEAATLDLDTPQEFAAAKARNASSGN